MVTAPCIVVPGPTLMFNFTRFLLVQWRFVPAARGLFYVSFLSGSLWLGWMADRPPYYKSHRVSPPTILSHLLPIELRFIKEIYTNLRILLPFFLIYFYQLRISIHTATLGTLRFSFSGESHTRSARHLILVHQNSPSDTFVPRATKDTKLNQSALLNLRSFTHFL